MQPLASPKTPPHNPFWWIDAGNGENYGQILIGNSTLSSPVTFPDDRIIDLPLPTIQRPEILAQQKRQSCSESVEAGEQGPVINQLMASLVVEVVRRMIEGTCHWVQLYLDLENGTLVPIQATIKVNKKATRKSRKKGGAS